MYVLNSSICFIGMPGVGKTTLAFSLAKEFSLPVIDLDQAIEQYLQMPISEFWTLKGELGFRCLERFHLLRVLSGKPVLLATGGGTPCFFDNLRIINAFSFSIYLKSHKPKLTDNMKSGNHPVFKEYQNQEARWNELLLLRKSWYERSQVIQNAFLIEPNVHEVVSKFCLENNFISRL